MKKNNFFVYGMTCSGKDTVSNYLRSEYGYMKLRVAQTIKVIICEKLGISFDELEVLKRTDPKIRQMHHEVSAYMDEGAIEKPCSLTRCRQLVDGTSMEFHHWSHAAIEATSKVICDVRTKDEANIFLNAGYIGIFLTRLSDEYKDSTHYTENNMFFNGQIKEYTEDHNFFHQRQQIIIIDNSCLVESTEIFGLKGINHYSTEGSPEELFRIIDLHIECSKNN